MLGSFELTDFVGDACALFPVAVERAGEFMGELIGGRGVLPIFEGGFFTPFCTPFVRLVVVLLTGESIDLGAEMLE